MYRERGEDGKPSGQIDQTADDHHVEPPFMGVLHHSIELWPGILLARESVVYIGVEQVPAATVAVFL